MIILWIAVFIGGILLVLRLGRAPAKTRQRAGTIFGVIGIILFFTGFLIPGIGLLLAGGGLLAVKGA